jgi:hypothetical protein
VGLGLNVHPHHLKACPVIAHAGSPSSTEQIKNPHSLTSPASPVPAHHCAY